MNNIIPFQFKSSTVRIIVLDDEDVYYIASDVAIVLGYSNPAEAVRDHCKHANTLKNILNSNSLFSNEIKDLRSSTLVIPESDVNRLIMRSKLESAEVFQDWLAEDVIPTIRKTGSYSTQQPEPFIALAPTMPELQIAEVAARMLRMSDTSKARMLTIICEDHGVSPRFLPNYSDEQLTMALGDLLKKHGASLSAVKANPILESMGLLKKLERRAAKGETKAFWSITDDGLIFGKNETSKQSPNETQPRWYVAKFPDLLAKINQWLADDSEVA